MPLKLVSCQSLDMLEVRLLVYPLSDFFLHSMVSAMNRIFLSCGVSYQAMKLMCHEYLRGIARTIRKRQRGDIVVVKILLVHFYHSPWR